MRSRPQTRQLPTSQQGSNFNIPNEFKCPYTKRVMVDPVVLV